MILLTACHCDSLKLQLTPQFLEDRLGYSEILNTGVCTTEYLTNLHVPYLCQMHVKWPVNIFWYSFSLYFFFLGVLGDRYGRLDYLVHTPV